MFKNLLRVALRNFKKDKWYTLLNVIGLTIGITFSLFLIFYIKDELSYDKYNRKADRIYRLNSYIKEPEKDVMNWAVTPFPLAPALKNDYPEVEQSVRFVGNPKTMFKYGDVKFYEEKTFYVDSNVFKIFTLPLIYGNPNTALNAPNSIVLNRTLSEKFFGKNVNPLGKALDNDRGEHLQVTGVMEDVPLNSHLVFNALESRSTLPADFANNWGGFGFYTYVLLKPNTNASAFEKKLLPIYDKYMAQIFAQYNIKIRLGIQKITDIHLKSEMVNEPEELGSMSYIYIFGSVAFFMLIIACINYMNLTTARSARRAKEIGIRKVTGSSRGTLIAQFLVESILTSFFALLLSLILIALLLPIFNSLSGKSITFTSLFEPSTFVILLGIVLFAGFVGGSYPAFYLSKFNPVHVLKGSLSKSSGNVALRRVLVVLQFSISMIMLICTWIVYAQLKFVRNKDLGFNKDHVVAMTVNGGPGVDSKVTAFKNELRNLPAVSNVATAQTVPGGNINFNLFSIETDKGFTEKGVDVYAIDENYLNTLGMQIKKGRNFSGLPDTLHSIIVNENMVKYFGWDEPLGKRVKFPGDTTGFALEVVGVVKDFNQKSLYNPIAPLIMLYRPTSNNIVAKVAGRDIPKTVASVENSWKKVFPESPFSYTFLDADFNSQYEADQKRGQIFTTFAILTIIITCLGLLGLIAFTTQQRQKEISIRKIMGAGLKQLVPLITGNFVLLVAISCLIAFPVAYLFMDKWLKIFPYNTGLSVTPFILSAVAVLLITLLTVMFHTVKAAVANPANNLRTE